MKDRKLKMKRCLAGLLVGGLSMGAQAGLIGFDGFDYGNGTPLTNSGYNDAVLDGQSGGAGWDFQRTDEGVANSPSDWDSVFGAHPTVTGGGITLSSSGVVRQFSGSTEGAGNPSNEREGAFRGTGAVYFRTTFTYNDVANDSNDWTGVSNYDFGTELNFMGVVAGPNEFAIQIHGQGQAGINRSGIFANFGETYTLIGKIDYDNDVLAMWVNPDGSDTDSAAGGSADVITAGYTSGNWTTAVRLAAGAGASSVFDEIVVSDDFATVAVPEPTTFALVVLGVVGLISRRR